MRRTYAILATVLAAVAVGFAIREDSVTHAPTAHAVITGQPQGFVVTFPDGSSLPVSVAETTGQTAPANKLRPHTVTLGTEKTSQVHVTLTPGKVIPPLLPTGPSGTTGDTGPTGSTGTTSSTSSTTTTTTTTTSTTSSGSPGQVTLDAPFASTVSPFSPQCQGTPSKMPRYRGTYAFTSVAGINGVAITVPTTPAGYKLTACNLNSPHTPMGLGTDEYMGVAFYVPPGFQIPNNAFEGINAYEIHTQFVWGSPVILQLHDSSVVLALETGGCNPAGSANPGCDYRSNAGQAPCRLAGVSCLPGYYAIPPGRLVAGAWNEVVVHADWESTPTGSLQTWYRTLGGTWSSGDSVSGIPTVQWDRANPGPTGQVTDSVEVYTPAVTAPLTVTFADAVDGTSFNAVAGVLP